jgi:hypothetical protein
MGDSRLAGDDYQHLLAWWYLLGLMLSWCRIKSVTVEDPKAGFVDDITVEYEADAPEPDLFVQVKYHVDHREQYSTEVLLAAQEGSRSLLRKLHESWQILGRRSRPVELRLVSNWVWASNDPVRAVIRGQNNGLSEKFFTATPKSAIGKARARWQAHLNLADAEFRAFVSTLRFRTGFDSAKELEQRVAERMISLGLRGDISALLVGVGIVRELIKARRVRLMRPDLEALVATYSLRQPSNEEPATTVYLTTVAAQQFDIPPDVLLDWRELFEGEDTQHKGHGVLDPESWNAIMLPELRALRRRLDQESPIRLVRARGLARLSAWFAFGYVFSDVARYKIEVDQQGKLWRTDAEASNLAVIEQGCEAIEGGDSAAVAVGISVSGSLQDDVRRELCATRAACAALFLRPDRALGRECLASAGDVVAFARAVKERMRAFVREHGARRVLLFYFGPLSGACFLGHQLNAVAREIQIMEDQQPGYAPSFLLA